jgi:hypothetical protein
MAHKPTLNVHRDNTADWRGQVLCPFRDSPFVLDKHWVRTVEGFVLTLRLPSYDTRRIITLMEDAETARRTAGRITVKKHVWWNAQKIATDSPDFRTLFERMLRARLRKDRPALKALADTHGVKFVHEAPRPDSMVSMIPLKLYFRLLTELRKELLANGEIAK